MPDVCSPRARRARDTALAFECERAIEEMFDAATGVEAEPGLGVVA